VRESCKNLYDKKFYDLVRTPEGNRSRPHGICRLHLQVRLQQITPKRRRDYSSSDTLVSYSGGARFESWAGTSAILTDICCGFPRSLQVNPSSRLLSLPSKSFPIHYSPIILSFNAIQSSY
jgi:hypothetical protein